MNGKTTENKIVCDEHEVIKIVKATMLPDIHALQNSVELLRKDIQYLLENREKRDREVNDDMGKLRSEIHDIRITLYGNGKQEGLETRLTRINDWMNARIWFERLVIGALVVQILGFLILIGQHVLSAQ